ncbi:MAG TPA: hypothetical protein VH643_30395 [Gemmataceae bacterium]|jgi:hypothetical protein
MSQQVDQPQPETSHFDAAKSIVEALKGLDKTSQTLALRFASETLGLQLAATAQMPNAPVTAASPSVPQHGIGGATHSTDIKQFAAAKAPKSDQQFAAVVAYFYRFEAPEAQRKDAIDADALQEAARLAGRRRPPKPGMTLTNAKNAGYLDAAGNGLFRINSVGENLVAMALPGNGSEDSPRRRPRKRNIAKKKTQTEKITKKTQTARPGG